jgi:hypothetical protein
MTIPGTTGAKLSVLFAAIWTVGFFLSTPRGCVIGLKETIGLDLMLISSFPLVLLAFPLVLLAQAVIPVESTAQAVGLGALCILTAANFLILGYGLSWCWNQVRDNLIAPTKPTKAEQAVSSDGQKPSNSESSAGPTAPADAL